MDFRWKGLGISIEANLEGDGSREEGQDREAWDRCGGLVGLQETIPVPSVIVPVTRGRSVQSSRVGQDADLGVGTDKQRKGWDGSG